MRASRWPAFFHRAFAYGGGGQGYIAGDGVKQTFSGTGLASATSAIWDFNMSNFTREDVINKFDALINGVIVDSFYFVSAGDSADVHFHFSESFAAIAGDSYTLELTATSTVFSGGGSWNFYPGGTVELSGANGGVPEPGTWAMMLMGFGGLGAALRRRRAVALVGA